MLLWRPLQRVLNVLNVHGQLIAATMCCIVWSHHHFLNTSQTCRVMTPFTISLCCTPHSSFTTSPDFQNYKHMRNTSHLVLTYDRHCVTHFIFAGPTFEIKLSHFAQNTYTSYELFYLKFENYQLHQTL